MKPKTYNLMERCIEDGVARGYRRAFKHTDDPGEDAILDNIVSGVMLELSEWFDFEAVEE
jgi:hypothetical protein